LFGYAINCSSSPNPVPPIFEPVPPAIIRRVPLDVWLSIMRWIHPRAAFRLATVSKAFKNMIYSSSYASATLAIHWRTEEDYLLQAVFLSVPSKEFQDAFARRHLTTRETYNMNYLFQNYRWIADHPIPPALSKLTNLRVLSMNETFCNGPIPRELGNLNRLTMLLLTDNHLSGPIPPELGLLTNLIDLSLKENKELCGHIPRELGNLNLLERLDIRQTSITGPIPSELGNLRNLNTLDLSGCKRLNSSIPPELGNLESLIYLNLGDCSLIGPIPSELAKLTKLEYLCLENNDLTGKVPIELNTLERLLPPSLDGNKKLTCSFRWRNTLPAFVPEYSEDEDSVYTSSDSSDVD
ncbi:hypothetical protein HDU99_008576, partial [Rhizoclosmatium hyalinum]